MMVKSFFSAAGTFKSGRKNNVIRCTSKDPAIVHRKFIYEIIFTLETHSFLIKIILPNIWARLSKDHNKVKYMKNSNDNH